MKSVMITGSSQGLGKCLAFEFARHKWNVLIHGRDESRLKMVRTEIRRIQNNSIEFSGTYIVGDIVRSTTRIEILQAAKDHNIDVLINNAGAYWHGHFKEMTMQEIRDVIEVNMIAPIQLIKRLYPFFYAKQSGTIININSVAGRFSYELESVYCASKNGFAVFSRAFQEEANEYGINVVSVFPRAMQTQMTVMRESYPKLMRPTEVASQIYRLVVDYKTMRISELDIARKKH